MKTIKRVLSGLLCIALLLGLLPAGFLQVQAADGEGSTVPSSNYKVTANADVTESINVTLKPSAQYLDLNKLQAAQGGTVTASNQITSISVSGSIPNSKKVVSNTEFECLDDSVQKEVDNLASVIPSVDVTATLKTINGSNNNNGSITQTTSGNFMPLTWVKDSYINIYGSTWYVTDISGTKFQLVDSYGSSKANQSDAINAVYYQYYDVPTAFIPRLWKGPWNTQDYWSNGGWIQTKSVTKYRKACFPTWDILSNRISSSILSEKFEGIWLDNIWSNNAETDAGHTYVSTSSKIAGPVTSSSTKKIYKTAIWVDLADFIYTGKDVTVEANYQGTVSWEGTIGSNSSSNGSSAPSTEVSPEFSLGDANDILSPDYSGRVTVDFEKEIATLNGVEAFKVEYAAIKLDNRVYLANVHANQWEDATGETTVDLSWISKSKDQAIVFKFTAPDGSISFDMLPCKAQVNTLKVGLATTSSAITIKGAQNVPDFTGKVTGTSEQGYLYFYTLDSKSKQATAVSPSTIQWRKGTSGYWTDEEDTSVSDYLQAFKDKGSTIYFRLKSDGKAWVSKEVKLAYKKQANAPKLTYSTQGNTVTLKAGQEYQIKVGNGEWSDWINVSKAHGASTRKVALDKLYTNFSQVKEECTTVSLGAIYTEDESISINVRTAANESKNTIASKTSNVRLTVPTTSDTAIGVTESAITVAYKDAEDPAEGLTLKNNTEVDYEFGITIEGKEPTKWRVVKAGKEISIKAGDYTKRSCAAVRIPGNSKLYRLPGEVAYISISELQQEE